MNSFPWQHASEWGYWGPRSYSFCELFWLLLMQTYRGKEELDPQLQRPWEKYTGSFQEALLSSLHHGGLASLAHFSFSSCWFFILPRQGWQKSKESVTVCFSSPLNVADMKSSADAFPTQSCRGYNLQHDQAHASPYALPLAQNLKNPHLKGKSKLTNPTIIKSSGCAHSRRSLCDCRLLLTDLRAVASYMSSTKAIISKLNPDP